MSEIQANFTQFCDAINEDELIWALQNQDGDWVVCDSSEFENADVMPIWANEANAQTFCVDEWQDYNAASIPLEEFLEDWISEFNDDGVLLGVDWKLDQEGIELDPIDVAKLIVKA